MKEYKMLINGKCPQCLSENLSYKTCVNEGMQLYYPFICEDCNYEGKEWYSLTYIESV
jgi:hypothetical protein